MNRPFTPHAERRHVTLDLPFNTEWYVELTGAQHLAALLVYFLTGKPIQPSAYAKQVGITRVAVYHQMRQLSQMGVPVVRVGYGKWTLMPFVPPVDVFEGLRYDN